MRRSFVPLAHENDTGNGVSRKSGTGGAAAALSPVPVPQAAHALLVDALVLAGGQQPLVPRHVFGIIRVEVVIFIIFGIRMTAGAAPAVQP